MCLKGTFSKNLEFLRCLVPLVPGFHRCSLRRIFSPVSPPVTEFRRRNLQNLDVSAKNFESAETSKKYHRGDPC